MKHRHRHHSGGMLRLDFLAAHSGLANVSPAVKAGFSVVALVICVSAADAVVGIAVALSMALLMKVLGKTPFSQIARLLSIPLLFLVVSCLVVLLEAGDGRFFTTPDSRHRAFTLFFQTLGAVSCLYFLSTTTPMPQLIEVLRRCHVPELAIELMYLIYRYLFVLLDVQQKLTVAATSRMGYNGTRRAIGTAGRISGAVLASSFRRSSQCFDAMESRGYDGKLLFLTHMPPLRWGHLFAALGYLALLLILVFIRKGI